MLRSSARVFSYHRSVVPSSMLARVRSAAVLGIDAYLVDVETDIANGRSTFWTRASTLPERLLDADFPHERAKARIWAEGVEARCRRDEHEPFGALLVGRLQPAQRLLVVPQA